MEHRYEVHKDESPCEINESNSTCPQIGTGIHEPIDVHLARAHGLNDDVLRGIRMGAKTSGVDEITAMFNVHAGIMMFQPPVRTNGLTLERG